MSTTQHPLTDEQYELLVNRHIDPRCLADEACSMGYEAGRTEKIMMSLPPQHLVFEKDNELIEKDIDYRDRLLALVEFVANWEPVAVPDDPHHDPRPWQDCTRADIREGDLVETQDGGFLYVGVAHHRDSVGRWFTKGGYLLTSGDHWPLRRIPAHAPEKETPMTKNAPTEPLARTLLRVPEGHGAPHHDASRIKAGDYVAQVYHNGDVRAGRVHYQDQDGDWMAEAMGYITWAAYRAARPDAITVWPAPTPPAEEVELPTKHPAHLIDVEDTGGDTFAHMALDAAGDWCGVDLSGMFHYGPPSWLTAFTLPDGTRARRDGDRPDGTPRFVKEGEK